MDKDKRIEYAKAILTNPLYIEKMAELDEQFINKWKSTLVSDVEGREETWRLLKIKNMFQSIISMCAVDENKAPEIPLTDYDTG